MPKLELSKSIEARKLNRRTRLPTKDPFVAIPYGAIIEDLEQDRDLGSFSYLGELYQCPYTTVAEASRPIEAGPAAPAATAETAPPAADEQRLRWQALRSTSQPTMRAKVPGGWLVATGGGVTFYPDPNHDWNGGSLP